MAAALFCTFSLSSLENKIKGSERANQYYLGVRRKNGKIGQKVSKKERKKRHVRRRLLDSISDRTSGRNERIFSPRGDERTPNCDTKAFVFKSCGSCIALKDKKYVRGVTSYVLSSQANTFLRDPGVAAASAAIGTGQRRRVKDSISSTTSISTWHQPYYSGERATLFLIVFFMYLIGITLLIYVVRLNQSPLKYYVYTLV